MSSIRPQRVLLFGDPRGIPQVLRAVPASLVIGVVGAQIRPLQHTELRDQAEKERVPFLIQPKYSSSVYAEFVKSVEKLRPDLILVDSYSMFLGPDVLSLPQSGAINIHGG